MDDCKTSFLAHNSVEYVVSDFRKILYFDAKSDNKCGQMKCHKCQTLTIQNGHHLENCHIAILKYNSILMKFCIL